VLIGSSPEFVKKKNASDRRCGIQGSMADFFGGRGGGHGHLRGNRKCPIGVFPDLLRINSGMNPGHIGFTLDGIEAQDPRGGDDGRRAAAGQPLAPPP